MKKANLLILFVAVLLLDNSIVLANATQNPLQHFYSNYEIFVEDELVTFYADLNEDGVAEVFVSTTSARRNNAKAGRLWELYISSSQGYFHYSERSQLGLSFSAPRSLVRLNNGRLAVLHYHASNARQGGVIAYYLDVDNNLKMKEFDEFTAQPGEFDSKYADTVSKHGRPAPKSKVEFKVSPLDQVFSKQQVSQLKSYEDDFWATHHFSNDPDSPDTLNQLVHRKSDGKFIGYLVNGELVPADEYQKK